MYEVKYVVCYSLTLSTDEKHRILEAIEKDREFRYALMGLLGLSELLERFAQLEERFARLEEKFAELEERQRVLEERFAKLEERFAQLEERFARLEEEMIETRRVVIVIAHRFGVITEESFRQAMKYVVERSLGVAKVERWIYNDTEGLVYGHPSIVEVDVVVRNSEHILVEVKSKTSKADIAELYRIGELYEKIEGVKPKLVIIGGFIEPGARGIADKLGVELIPIVT